MLSEWYQHIVFAYPYLLWLLLLLPLLIVWYAVTNRKSSSSVTVSSLSIYRKTNTSKNVLWHMPFVLRLLALALLIIAFARPQKRSSEERVEGEGIDIVLCVDVSGTMLYEDFLPNRLEALKKVAIEFVNARKTDRIGLVIFAGEAFTQCPLTTDYITLKNQIQLLRSGILQSGTSIGDGLATSVERLKDSKTKSKVIILLTDGESNGGLLDPNAAKELAKYFKIKVYTIGMGTEGLAPLTVKTEAGLIRTMEKVNIDEKLLTEIANETGGNYFRATDNESLTKIYADIDELEKSKFETSQFARYSEEFYPLVFAIMALLLLEVWLRYKVLRKFP